MKVVIAGGGTGGHLYPGIALAEGFRHRHPESGILFVGTTQGLGTKAFLKKGYLFEAIASTGFVGKGTISKLKAFLSVPIGLLQSICILRRFSPNLVIGVGGYASGPVLLAAVLLKVKRAILEPNLVPGLVNKVVAPFCHMVVTTFEESAEKLKSRKIRQLGVPIRPEILCAALIQRKEGRKTILILGGSQGAHSINEGMIAALPFLQAQKNRLHFIHQTGKRDWERVRTAYVQSQFSSDVIPFVENMGVAYASADWVISRAGAGTLSELAALGKASLLVPYPHAGGHQEKNALAFASAGASRMILDGDLDGKILAGHIVSLLDQEAALEKMGEAARKRGRPNATADIVSACLELTEAP